MTPQPRTYTGTEIDVTFDAVRCIHSAECLRRLGAVFDVERRPWILPDNAPAEAVIETIGHCPSGALHVQHKDGTPAEPDIPANTLRLQPNGPLFVRGDVTILEADGTPLQHETRAALCRCGQSANKPYCDNTHRECAFEAPAQMDQPSPEPIELLGGPADPLTITLAANGPLRLEGPYTLLVIGDEPAYTAHKGALCRCGGSANKPFCDGTHNRNGFTG